MFMALPFYIHNILLEFESHLSKYLNYTNKTYEYKINNVH